MEQHPPFDYPRTEASIPAGIKTAPGYKELYYQCPDACWTQHCHDWGRAYREARATRSDEELPRPMPYNHVVFDDSEFMPEAGELT